MYLNLFPKKENLRSKYKQNRSQNPTICHAHQSHKLKEKTGISSLKIRYNNVFGYYIEITNTHKDKAPDRYQRKQTLANAERYCTDELIELEKKVLSAQVKRFELEFALFDNLRHESLIRFQIFGFVET